MVALSLMRRALITQLAEHPIASFCLQLFDEPPCSVAFQIGEDAQIGRGNNGVEVRLENDPGMDLERFMRATVFEGLHEDVAAGRVGEDGEPGDCRAGMKWAKSRSRMR